MTPPVARGGAAGTRRAKARARVEVAAGEVDGVVIDARSSADKIRAAGDVDERAGVTALDGTLARGPGRPGPGVAASVVFVG